MQKFLALLVLLLISCSRDKPQIVLKEIHNRSLNTIEKGAEVNGIKEGYWITLDENRMIEIESYYSKGKLNGPIKLYDGVGKLMSEGYMQNDSTNGLWQYYFGSGDIRAKGELKNGDRIGVWDYYVEGGKLDKRVIYRNGNDSTLIDNQLSLPVPEI